MENRKAIILLLGILIISSCEKEDEVPVIDNIYRSEVLSGFRIKMKPGYPENDATWIADMRNLEKCLDTMLNYIPYSDLDMMQDIPIYISYPSKDFAVKFWQPGNSDSIDDKNKIGCIEIGNLNELINNLRNKEPGLLIYAFSLQYYESLNGTERNKIAAAYQTALQKGIYNSVDHYTPEGITAGENSPASKSERDYFAKISEAYFNISDYYPFVYEDLKEYDPDGFSMLVAIWGVRKIKNYIPVNGHGFEIMIRKDESENQEVLNAVEKAFETLGIMSDSLNTEILTEMRKRPVWVEYNNGNGACFHPNKLWILENGHVPEKTHCVEITNATNFNDWIAVNQPLIVWHELSHYYHYHVAGWENSIIRSAYEKAKAAGLHRNVEHIRADGTKHIVAEAYALTNEKEYFAELSEAYWGMNDFYPYTRDQLSEYDTTGYKMIETIWQVN
ncbi:MAG TPA: hypothetical protein ENH59_02445 [Bacteroidetes bacterium]|nr:hypothetical protein [Bacteroidota bacterium]